MTFAPEYLLALLLLNALITAAFAAVRPQAVRIAALLGIALFTFAWIATRGALPLTVDFDAAGAVGVAWSWQIGQLSWFISLAVLLLGLGALAFTPPSRAASQILLIQLLASAALLTTWAGNFATYVLTWTLLNLLWLIAVAWHERQAPRQGAIHLRTQVPLALAGILLLWLAGSSVSASTPASAWSTLARSLVLLAATYQLLVFPFYLRRAYQAASPPLAALLHAAPAASAVLLLSRLEAASDIGLAFALPFTLVGLFALFSGAHRAWSATPRRVVLPVALVQAQSGFVLLAAVWAGPQALLAESIVLLLAGGILLLAVEAPAPAIRRLALQPGVVIAIAALAALPLTRGFAGRGATYGAWLDEGRWLLVGVTVLLHVPLLVVAFRSFLPQKALAREPAPGAAASRVGVVSLSALLLPALGLLSLPPSAGASVTSWLVVPLPAVLAALLAWRLKETVELRRALREAITLPIPRRPVWFNPRRVLAAAGAALREAFTLLEGEGGLLWLLVFVVVIYLMR